MHGMWVVHCPPPETLGILPPSFAASSIFLPFSYAFPVSLGASLGPGP